jgi:GNAT superfamily N-acetyltransferase
MDNAVPEIQRETLSALRNSVGEALLYEHWKEIAHYKDIALEVDWPLYEDFERSGKFRLFTVRMGNEVVGYAAYFVNHNPHYKSSYQAVQDVLYLAPAYRKAAIGRHLIAYADAMLRGEGVQVTYQHSKVAQPIDALLVRQKYELIERIWAKRLDL